MALNLTNVTKNLSTQSVIEPNLIFEVEGIPLLFGVRDVEVLPFFDDEPPLLFDNGVSFDTPIRAKNSRAYLEFDGAANVKQQLLPDKGGAGSVASIRLKLINKSGELTELFSTGVNIDDIFGAKSKLFIGFNGGGSHPEDSNELFRGLITDISTGAGFIRVVVSHPDQYKRQSLFDNITTRLSLDITGLDTTINVDSTDDFIIPTNEENFESYIRIDDEIIKLSTNITPTTFDNVLRAQLDSIPSTHEVPVDVQSFYRLKGQPVDLSLRLLISGADNETVESIAFRKFGEVEIPNALFFADNNIADELGVAIGDQVVITGSINPSNNGTKTVNGFDFFAGGSYLLFSDTEFITEIDSANVEIISQYNTLPIGLAISPSQIDMEGTIEIKNEIDFGLPFIDIYIEEQVENMKEWLEKEIYKPNGLYAINRKGRISLKFTRPAIADEEIKIISPETVVNESITKLELRRSFSRYFYNQVTYSFERNPVRDKYEANTFIVSADSLARVKLGAKQLLHEANGLRDNGATRQAIQRIGTRVLNRYQFGARYLNDVQVLFRTGYAIEVGDTVLVKDLKIPDLEKNSDIFTNVIMEVINKTLNIKTGEIKLNLLETSFSVDSRFATVAPSSKVQSLKTSKSVKIIRSFGVSDIVERTKYDKFIGEKLQIRSADYSQSQVLTLDDFNLSDESELTFLEDITIPVDNTYIVELPNYNDAGVTEKLIHGFVSPDELVLSGASNTEFDATTSSLFVGAVIQITKSDFTAWSNEATILNISGSTITVDKDLGFLPLANDIIGIIGFSSDNGEAYRLV